MSGRSDDRESDEPSNLFPLHDVEGEDPDIRGDEFDEDAFFEAWAAAERHAAEVLATRLEDVPPVVPDPRELADASADLRDAHGRGDRAAGWMLRAAGIDEPTEVPDTDLLIRAVAATISMVEDPGLDPEQAAPIMSLELADWVGAILGLVHAGPGSSASATTVVAHVVASDAVEGDPLDVHDRQAVEHGFLLVQPAWGVTGVVELVDVEPVLTRLGAWLLPAAAMHAWTDAGPTPPEAPDDPLEPPLLHGAGDSGAGWVARHDGDGFDIDDDRDDEAASVLRELLATHGPLDEGDVLDRLADDGTVEVAGRRAVADLLWNLPKALPARDGRWVHLPSLAEGRTFTHRVTALEVDEQRVASLPDFGLYLTFLPPLALVAGGEVIEQDWHGPPDPRRPSSLFGPDGWLPEDLQPGDLLAGRVSDGHLHVRRLAEADVDAEATERVAAHLRSTFDVLGGRNLAGGPIDVPELLLEVVVRHPVAFTRPTAPVEELLATAGLSTDDGAVLDPDAPDDPGVHGWVAELYGLDEHEANAVEILAGAVHLFDRQELDDVPSETARDLLRMLDLHPAVAEALSDTQLGITGIGAATLERFVRLVRPHGPRSAPLCLLDARVAEARGDVAAGEAALRRAVQLDPDCAPAHEDLAWYLEDRGDTTAALRALRLAGVDDDDAAIHRLREHQQSRPSVGRNEPCPCGSGTKYKRCCGPLGGPLPDRVGALMDKMWAYLNRPIRRLELMPLLEARAGDARDQRRLVDTLDDGLVFDVALFDDRWIEEFLHERGPLLPADEYDLATSWVGIARSLYEVVEVDAGTGMTLLDLRSGDRTQVRERVGSTEFTSGQGLFARVVPAGTGHQLTGGTLRIPVQHRESLLGLLDTTPSAVETCGWMAALEAPPRLVTMEGEPTVFCRAEYRLGDPARAASTLAQVYEGDTDGHLFADVVDLDGQHWNRGTIRIRDDRLVIEANAEARLDRIRSTVEDLLDDLELLDETRRPAADLFNAGRQGQVDPDPLGDADRASLAAGPDELPDELRTVLEDEVKRHERAWVDESIPMLDGLTPRQALKDPTRRDKLQAMLDEMDDDPPPGMMSARRIRRLLGLGLL